MKAKQKSSKNISGAQRPIDVYFQRYSEQYPSLGNKIILSIFLLAFYFAAMGMIWIIPFPHVKWLGSYNGYFSWASFFIAAIMYYWYKQSRTLSYFLLIILFVIAYAVSQQVEMSALIGPPVWTICVPVGLAAFISLYLINRKRGAKGFLINIILMPVWLVSLLGKQLGIKV